LTLSPPPAFTDGNPHQHACNVLQTLETVRHHLKPIRQRSPERRHRGQAWLTRDPARLAASLEEFTGHPAYGLDELRADLERFTFLPGGGEQLFGS
jgi:hypothetical protein